MPVPNDTAVTETGRSRRGGMRTLLRRPGAIFGIAVIVCLTLARIYIALFPYDPVRDLDLSRAFRGMSWAHPLGTDQLGRDIFLRILNSVRAFYFPGICACLLAVSGGVIGGALAGFHGGVFSVFYRYLVSILNAIPRFILILLVSAILGSNIFLIAAITGLTYLPQIAETVYRKVLFFRSMEFIEAAKAHGLPPMRILFYHIIYLNCLPPIIKHALYLFGYVILIETSLSYLGGFGVQEPQPSWGNMLAQAREYLFQGEMLFLTAPAAAIILTISGLVALGDAVSEWGH